jgi:hypothetical protein
MNGWQTPSSGELEVVAFVVFGDTDFKVMWLSGSSSPSSPALLEILKL